MGTKTAAKPKQSNIYYYDLHENRIHMAVMLYQKAQEPSFSPDGKQICYWVGQKQFGCTLDSGRIAALEEERKPEKRSRTYHCVADAAGRMQLWRGTGKKKVQMTFDTGWDVSNPQPSPDGKQVAYLARSTEGGKVVTELRLIPAEGGNSRRLIRFIGKEVSVSADGWAADGSGFALAVY